jgi:maleylacetate reductase
MYSTMIGMTSLQRVHSGRPVAEALAEEAERIGAKRVFLVASHSLNTRTDEIAR